MKDYYDDYLDDDYIAKLEFLKPVKYRTLKCPICGKPFCPAPLHVFQTANKVLICSWHCQNEYNKARDGNKDADERLAEQDRKEREKQAKYYKNWKERQKLKNGTTH